MFVIANNISTRRAEIKRLFYWLNEVNWSPDHEAAGEIKTIVHSCVNADADAIEIDTQQHFDTPDAMEYAVNLVQQATDKQLCLSSNNPEALEAGLKICRRPPIVNYVSLDVNRIAEMLTSAANHQAEVVLLASDPSQPNNVDDMIGRTQVLVEQANGMGISSNRIYIDPGIYHVTDASGQEHIVNVMEFLKVLSDTFDPPLRTTCWINNSSSGVPGRIRPVIDTTLLAMLAAVGMSSVFINVLRPENMRAVRLIKVIQNETPYAEAELLLNPKQAGKVEV